MVQMIQYTIVTALINTLFSVLWHPGDDKSSVVSLDETHIRFWDLENPKQVRAFEFY
jgi:WD40 repeat protein